MNSSAELHSVAASRGLTATGVFLLFGTAMATLAGVTLIWRGTSLDRLWALNPRAYAELTPLGRAPGFGFLFLGGVLALAAAGWFTRKMWGWWMTVVLIAAQVVGGVVHLLMARIAEGAIGVSVAGLLFIYLLRPRTKGAFGREAG